MCFFPLKSIFYIYIRYVCAGTEGWAKEAYLWTNQHEAVDSRPTPTSSLRMTPVTLVRFIVTFSQTTNTFDTCSGSHEQLGFTLGNVAPGALCFMLLHNFNMGA